MKPQFSISKDGKTLLMGDQPFYVSQIANDCMGHLNVGCVVPSRRLSFYESGWAKGTVLVGTGSCCEGFVVALCEGEDDSKDGCGKIVAIQAIDFNVYRISPVIFWDNENERLGFLVTGSGCSGMGVRFVHFKALPVVIQIVSTDEAKALPTKILWSTFDPLCHLRDIWDRLGKNGINVDQERTIAAQTEFSFFGRVPR